MEIVQSAKQCAMRVVAALALALAALLLSLSPTSAHAEVLGSGDGWNFDLNLETMEGTLTIEDNNFASKDQLEQLAPWNEMTTNLVIKEGVMLIPDEAFKGFKNISSVNLPSSMMMVAGSAFAGCSSLSSFAVASGNTAYDTLDGVLFTRDHATLVAYPGGKSGGYTVPEDTNVGNGAFMGCAGLTSVTIPDSITLGYAAFDGCKNLASVTFLGSAFTNFYTFRNCTSLTSLSISGAATLGTAAFQGCSSLQTLTLEGVSSLGASAFKDCVSLESATLNVSSLGLEAFSGCLSLATVEMTNATPPACDSNVFASCSGNLKIKVPAGTVEAYQTALGASYADLVYDGTAPAEKYSLFVNGVQFEDGALTMNCGEGTAVFDPATSTLTLTNATITKAGGTFGYQGCINSGLADLTIVLVGSNSITSATDDGIDSDFGCNISLVGQNGASLSISCTNNDCYSLWIGHAHQDATDMSCLSVSNLALTCSKGIFAGHNMEFTNSVVTAPNMNANHQVTLNSGSITAGSLSLGTDPADLNFPPALVMNGGSLALDAPAKFWSEGTTTINGGTLSFSAEKELDISSNAYVGPWHLAYVKASLPTTVVAALSDRPLMLLEDGWATLVKDSEIDELNTLKMNVSAGQPTLLSKSADLNNNGKVNIVDAQIAYDMAVLNTPLSSASNAEALATWLKADINNDHLLNALDAYAIQVLLFTKQAA